MFFYIHKDIRCTTRNLRYNTLKDSEHGQKKLRAIKQSMQRHISNLLYEYDFDKFNLRVIYRRASIKKLVCSNFFMKFTLQMHSKHRMSFIAETGTCSPSFEQGSVLPAENI